PDLRHRDHGDGDRCDRDHEPRRVARPLAPVVGRPAVLHLRRLGRAGPGRGRRHEPDLGTALLLRRTATHRMVTRCDLVLAAAAPARLVAGEAALVPRGLARLHPAILEAPLELVLRAVPDFRLRTLTHGAGCNRSVDPSYTPYRSE